MQEGVSKRVEEHLHRSRVRGNEWDRGFQEGKLGKGIRSGI